MTLTPCRGLAGLLILLIFLAGAAVAGRAEAARAYEVGLWVPAEGANATLDDAGKIRALAERARASGVTDLYVQVYRGGRAWYPTRLADDAPSRRAGRDPLAHIIELAGGIRVHAWINAFALARNREAPILKELGGEAILRDLHGRSLLDYPPDGKPAWAPGFGLGTPGIYLDPAHPGPRKRLAEIAAELARRYPGLAGVHLDYIRYPYALPISPGSRFTPRLDFGYGKPSVERFRAETGRAAPLGAAPRSAADHQAWDDWRRLQVTETVQAVERALRAARREVLLTAAVLPWADRAYLSAFQDWRGWLQAGLLDKAVLMNYTRDEALAAYISQGAAAWRGRPGAPRPGRVAVGLGAHLFDGGPEPLWRQWGVAVRAGADGVVLFAYDTMLRPEDFWKFPLP
ncbi:MAG: family 10 glycosylhydrolase [Nitrospinota bacterium]